MFNFFGLDLSPHVRMFIDNMLVVQSGFAKIEKYFLSRNDLFDPNELK